MRVLAFHNRYRVPGGELRVFEEETHLLEERGHAVNRVLVTNDDLPTNKLTMGASVVWNRSMQRLLEAEIQAFTPDVVHIHNDFPLSSPAIYYTAKKSGARVVHTLHNYRNICVNGLLNRDGEPCQACLTCGHSGPAIKNGCYRGSRLASAVAAARLTTHRWLKTWQSQVDVFFAPSRFVRERHIEAGFPEDKIHVKPHFVAGEPKPGAGRGGYALFVGRLMPDKGLPVLLDAWSRVAEGLQLKIIGDGPMTAEVLEAQRKTPSIDWLGPLPPEDVYRWMGDAAVVVAPSPVYESFGRTVIEAFAHGTPVIATGHGAMGELVEDGRTGWLIEPNRTDQLASAMQRALIEPKAYRKFAESRRDFCRQAYEAKYSQDANYEQLMSVYRQDEMSTQSILRLAA